MASLVLPIITGLAGLFGGAPKTTTSTQSGSTNQVGSSDTRGTTSSQTSPIASQIQQLLAQITGSTAYNQLKNNPYTTGGSYDAAGLQAINQGADNATKISKNILAQNGLSYSPYASYASMIPQNNRIGQQVQFQEQLPLLAQQQQNQNIDVAGRAAQIMPYGSSTSGTSSGSSNTNNFSSSSGTSTGTSPNEMLPGLFSGIGAGGAASGLFPTSSNSSGSGPNAQGNNSANLSNFFKMFGLH